MSAPGPTDSTPQQPISTPESFNTLLTEVNQLFADTTTKYPRFLEIKMQRQPDIEGQTKAQEIQREKEQILNELNRIEETYDADYLERKAAPPQRSIMTILGLKTTQDKTIALFYLAYVLFSIAFTLYIIRLSTKKIIAGSFILVILTGIGILLTLGLVNYG